MTEQQQVSVPVTREEVRLEREPITSGNRDAAYTGPDLTESEHEVTLHAERPVLNTETVPVERVKLGKETVTEQQTVGGEVRKSASRPTCPVRTAAAPSAETEPHPTRRCPVLLEGGASVCPGTDGTRMAAHVAGAENASSYPRA
ncbi:YsnF/AvaK domain-containing protein [Actinoplanes sp. NEAU-A12]|uniref:YsnF/AvaK domain-containing protein n=1 Tax=Actinoplanes sandaracinus TaxID=3045177 RepID=A0ABT6X1X6_9ACTN|nr:YsnF/AvaK domain-containing protein [Actinoplanes sandaracinus]MDI6105999.1 YsnF/AvaK domain-containing protein [Actinoplanes sandaracinus]